MILKALDSVHLSLGFPFAKELFWDKMEKLVAAYLYIYDLVDVFALISLLKI